MSCSNGSCSRPPSPANAVDYMDPWPLELHPSEVGRLKPLKKKADPKPLAQALKRPLAALSAWNTQDLAPALRLQVRKGHNVSVEAFEDGQGPGWVVRPQIDAESGVLPLIPLGIKGGLMALGTRVRRDAEIRRDPWGRRGQEEDEEVGGFGPGVGAFQDAGSLVLLDTDGYREDLS